MMQKRIVTRSRSQPLEHGSVFGGPRAELRSMGWGRWKHHVIGDRVR